MKPLLLSNGAISNIIPVACFCLRIASDLQEINLKKLPFNGDSYVSFIDFCVIVRKT